MKTLRQALLNSELQSDMKGNDHYILNLAGIGVRENRTAIVDPSITVDRGAISTHLPFQTLAGALAAINADRALHQDDRSGYVLIMRPGTYSWVGSQEIHIPNLTILAYGALVVSDSDLNEQTKLLITSNGVVIEGLTLDGSVDTDLFPVGFDDNDVPAGAIQVNHAIGVVIRNCTIQNFAAAGVYGQDLWHGLTVLDSNLTECQVGVLGKITATDVIDASVRNNYIAGNRRAGMKFIGSGNATTRKAVVNLLIESNDVLQNNQGNHNENSIDIMDYSRDVTVSGNHIQGGVVAIRLHKSYRATVNNNVIFGGTFAGIGLDGCQQVQVTGNNIDGRNASGSPVTLNGIYASGEYVTLNDAGIIVISHNILTAISDAGLSVVLANQHDVLVNANKLNAKIGATVCNFLQIKGNTITAPGSVAYITVDAGDTGCTGIEISYNRFKVNAASPSRLIETFDIENAGFTDLVLIGNSSTYNKTYTVGLYVHTGQAVIGRFLVANEPRSLETIGALWDGTKGWVNDDMTYFQTYDVETLHVNILDGGTGFFFDGNKVVGARVTGWTAATGAASRASFVTSAVTTEQLAQRVKALIDDLFAHGMIGT